MSEIGTTIMAAGLCDEGIEFEKIEGELLRLQNLLKSKLPICPHCLVVLEPFSYSGYYDSHCGWSCNCEKIPGAAKWVGQYA